MASIRPLVIRLIALLAALFLLYLLAVFLPLALRTAPPRLGAQQTRAAMPKPTPESAAIARAPQSFQYLVSFTSRGFEPQELTIKKGETVRFTNNTKETATIVGPAPFSSATLAPHDFTEITFENAGAYPYSDEATTQMGVVSVE